MADAKFSLGQIAITDYLIVRCRLVSDPATEISRQVFGPAPPTTVNIVFVGLQEDFYYFDVFESVNGIALTTLFNTFEINVASNDLVTEYRYYVVDRGNTSPIDGSVIDPISGTSVLNDPYLNGKTVASVEQRAFGKLKPTDEWTRTTTGIALTAPLLFSNLDTYILEVTHHIPGAVPAAPSTFTNEADITANTTLDSSYVNKIINANGVGTQLVITMDLISNIPTGSVFMFNDHEGGTQKQTKIKTQSGDSIKWRGLTMTEIWVGKGEHLWIKKRGTTLKVFNEHAGLNMVGQRFANTYELHPNTLPEDGALYGADDYPRLWWWLTTVITGGSIIVDDNLDTGGYDRNAVHPARQGIFIISTTKRKFRMPDTRNLSERGLKDFHTYGTDGSRAYDFPGGFQDQDIPTHDHATHGAGPATGGAGSLFLSTDGTGGNAHRYSGGGGDNFGGRGTPDVLMRTSETGGGVNIVKNIGVIYSRCV